MRLLLTGSSGLIGHHTLKYLLARSHNVTAVDIKPPPPDVAPSSNPTSSTSRATDASSTSASSGMATAGKATFVTCDLTDYKAVEELFRSSPKFDGVIHFGAIPHPLEHDPRLVHYINNTSSYNVMQTAAAYGIKRMVEASSVNAIGLSYTPEGHKYVHEFPITEDEPMTPEDPYAISKAEGELQATSLCRFFPGLRVASLRFHMCKPTYADAVPWSMVRDIFAWTSLDSCASAALLGLTSEGWKGHEAFNITAPEICYQGEAGDKTQGPSTVEVLEKHWGGRYGKIRKGWYEGHPRRSTWDSSKAERILGWNHDQAGEM